MDFLRYAEYAAELINAPVDDEAGLRRHLAHRPWLARRVTARDVGAVRRLREDLRALFGRSAAGDVIDGLNRLLRLHPMSPFISGHDEQSLHLHVAERESSVTDTLAAESLMGMAVLVCDLGADRFGICDAEGCSRAFVDISPNRSRRYCSDRCSSRANVAAFRARRKASTMPRSGPRP